MPNFKTSTIAIASEIVFLTELTAWLRIDEKEEADLVNGLIKSARARVENLANQDFVGKTYKIEIDKFVDKIETGINPIDTVTVSYIKNGVSEVFPAQSIRINGSKVTLLESKIVDNVYNALTLTITTQPNIQYLEIAKTAVKLLVGKWYDNRASQKYDVPDMVEAMLTGIRIVTC